jgi:hypothetical protein
VSIDGVIRRGDRKPLGSTEEVKAQLGKAFPGIQFTFVRDGGVAPSLGFSFVSLLVWLFAIREDFPHWEGSFEGDEFIAVFTVGTRPSVKAVRVTLYGRGTTNANAYFTTLFKQTGWRTKF